MSIHIGSNNNPINIYKGNQDVLKIYKGGMLVWQKSTGDTVVSHEGITYTFQGTVQAGFYQTGEPWVVGPVTLIAISPVPSVDNNNVAISGAMKNPQFNGAQAVDGRFSNYDSNLSLTLPANLVAGDVVIKAIGVTPAPSTQDAIRKGRMSAQSALFVRSTAPVGKRAAPAAFGWAGRSEPADYPFDASAVIAGVTTRDTSGHTNVPSYAALMNAIGKYNFGNCATSSTAWGGNAWGYEPVTVKGFSGDTDTNYGRYIASVIGAAGLALASNSYTATERENLLKALVRFGIGLYDSHVGAAVVQKGNGGHFQFNFLPVALALQYTGRSADLATLVNTYPTNHLAQCFEFTPAIVSSVINSHNVNTNPNASKQHTISGVTGNDLNFSESNSPYWWNYSQMEVVRISDGAKADLLNKGDQHGAGNVTINTQPTPAFATNDVVYFKPKYNPQDTWVDWTLTDISNLTEYQAGPKAPYRFLNFWADDIMALKALGVWHASFDKVEKYVAVAQHDNTVPNSYDYPNHTDGITLTGVGNWAQEWWDSYASAVGINVAYTQESVASPSTVDLTVGGSAKFPLQNGTNTQDHVTSSDNTKGWYSLEVQPLGVTQNNFFQAGEATFAIVRLPKVYRENQYINGFWGLCGNDASSTRTYRIGLYDGQNGLSGRRHKFLAQYQGNFNTGARIDAFSAVWDGDEALIVFYRKNNVMGIDIYDLHTGVKHAGPTYAKPDSDASYHMGHYPKIGVGANFTMGGLINGKAWPGELSMYGHVLPGSNFTDTNWQNIAKGADPITEFGGANFRWLRKLDGSAASLSPIPAVTSDQTTALQKGDNDSPRVGTNVIAGSHIQRKTIGTYLTVDPWKDGVVYGIHAGETTMPVTFSGNAAGLTGNVEVRTIYKDTGSVHKDWTTVGAIVGGSWTGTVQLPKSTNGWLVAQFRATSDVNNITDVREEFGIGWTIINLGQSQFNNAMHGIGRLDKLVTLHNATYFESLDNAGSTNMLQRMIPWQQADGLKWQVDQIRLYEANTPIMIINASQSGTSLGALLDDAVTSRKWSRLQAKLDLLTNSISVVVMNWGTADANQPEAKIKGYLDALVFGTGIEYKGQSLKDSLRAGFKFVISPLTRHSDDTFGDYADTQRWQVEWSNTNNMPVGPSIIDYRIENAGGPHSDPISIKGNPALGARSGMAVGRALGLDNTSNPYYDTAGVVRSNNTITIPIIAANGGVLSSPTPTTLTNWQVNGSSAGFTAALSGSNVVLTKASGNWSTGDTVTYLHNGETRAANDGAAEDQIINGVLYEAITNDVLSLGIPVVGSLSGGKWTPAFTVVV